MKDMNKKNKKSTKKLGTKNDTTAPGGDSTENEIKSDLHLVINPFGNLPSASVFDIPPQGIPEEYDQGELDAATYDKRNELTDSAAEDKLSRIANLIETTEKQITKDLEEQAAVIQQSEVLAQQIQDAVDHAYDQDLQRQDQARSEEQMPVPGVGWSESELDQDEIQASVEALFFLADKPLSFTRIDDALLPEFQAHLQAVESNAARHTLIRNAIERLQSRYQQHCSGVELVEVSGGYQLRTKIQRASLFKRLAKVTTQRLSRGAMETLAVVAYRQPVMKEDIDQVRGVDCSHFIRTLLERKLIQISGRSELPGRPILYTTSDDFLQIFGLSSLNQLPPLSEIEQLIPQSEIEKRNEDPRVIQMRKLVAQMQEASKNDTLGYSAQEDEVLLAEIKQKIQAIPTTTETVRLQAEAEKQAEVEGKATQASESL